MSEREFEPRLGRIGHRKSAKPKPFVRQVLDVAYKSGFKVKRSWSFTGQRIGRGAAWGTLASAGLMRGGNRRAVVKVRIAKLKSGNLSAARAHLRYIQRDGVDRNGEPGKLYGRATDAADGGVFVDGCDGDRHQFRIIVSPDDGDQMEDLKPFVRDLMQQMERDFVELALENDWYIDGDEGVEVYQFERPSKDGPYKMLHFVMTVRRQSPSRERRGPGQPVPVALEETRKAITRLFEQPKTSVDGLLVGKLKNEIEADLKDLFEYRSRYYTPPQA